MENVNHKTSNAGIEDAGKSKKPYIKPAVLEEIQLSTYSLGCMGRPPCDPIQVPKGS
jgi:hypothetical protein